MNWFLWYLSENFWNSLCDKVWISCNICISLRFSFNLGLLSLDIIALILDSWCNFLWLSMRILIDLLLWFTKCCYSSNILIKLHLILMLLLNHLSHCLRVFMNILGLNLISQIWPLLFKSLLIFTLVFRLQRTVFVRNESISFILTHHISQFLPRIFAAWWIYSYFILKSISFTSFLVLLTLSYSTLNIFIFILYIKLTIVIFLLQLLLI